VTDTKEEVTTYCNILYVYILYIGPKCIQVFRLNIPLNICARFLLNVILIL